MSRLINEHELSELLGLSVLTLRRTRCCNPERHPPYKKLGSSVRYDLDEVWKWIHSKTVNGLDDQIQNETPVTQERKRGAPSKIERIKKARNANG